MRARVLIGLGLVIATVTVVAVVETPRSIGEAEDVCVESFADFDGAPAGMTLARDGRFWFVEQFESRVGFFDPATRRRDEFQLVGEPHPHSIVQGADGKLWWVAPGGIYGSFDPRTRATAGYRQGIPPMASPHSIVSAADGFLYVSLQETGTILRIDPRSARSVPLRARLSPIGRPHGLTLDPDRRHLWVTLQNADEVVRIDLRSQRVDQRVRFSDASGPYELAFGPDGRVYVTLQYASKLGRYDPRSGEVDEFDMPVPVPRRGNDLMPGPKLTDLEPTADGDGIWMGTFVLNQLLRFDIESERVMRVTCGLLDGGAAYELVKGPDGAVWVSEPQGHAVGRIED